MRFSSPAKIAAQSSSSSVESPGDQGVSSGLGTASNGRSFVALSLESGLISSRSPRIGSDRIIADDDANDVTFLVSSPPSWEGNNRLRIGRYALRKKIESARARAREITAGCSRLRDGDDVITAASPLSPPLSAAGG